MSLPLLPGRAVLAGKKVLLIDRNQPTREVRATVVRSQGVEVHETESFQAARFLWQPNVYDLILLEVRRHLPERRSNFTSRSRIRALKSVSRPAYLLLAWPVKSPSPMPRRDSGGRFCERSCVE